MDCFDGNEQRRRSFYYLEIELKMEVPPEINRYELGKLFFEKIDKILFLWNPWKLWSDQ
jgi:hypothetical protein